MTSKSTYTGTRVLRKLAMTGMASGAALMLAAPAHSFDFNWGEVSGSLDSQVSAGLQMRVFDPSRTNLSAAAQQGGTIDEDSSWPDNQGNFPAGSFTSNSDDGDLNYQGGDLTSAALRVVHELELGWRNYGAFVRGNYFYDFVNTNFSEDALDEYPAGMRGDGKRPKAVEDEIGNNARLLDAYVYGNFIVADRFLNVRLGRQVVNWGESLFIGNSVNVINPINVPAFRVAGAEVRDALLPTNMLYAQMDLFGDTSAEAFVGLEWEPYRTDPRGGLFGGDIAGVDGRGLVLGSGRLSKEDAINATVFGAAPGVQPQLQTQSASDTGQFGIAIRQFLPQLASTELGFYFINHHQMLPIISWQKAGGTNLGDIEDPVFRNYFQNTPGAANNFNAGAIFVEYPEDINVWGVSFNTMLPTGTSWAGEISYKEDVPHQIHALELITAALDDAGANSVSQIDGAANFQPGETISGYRRHDVYQAQTHFIHAMGPGYFGARQWVLLGEVGVTHVPDLPSKDELRFNTGASPALKGPDPDGTDNAVTPKTQPNRDFADEWSWGYRVATSLSYNNVIGAWNMSPRLAYTHDVRGNSPGPSANFVAARKSATLGVQFDYLSRWEVDLSYASFFGNGRKNSLRDKDTINLQVSYSF